MAKKNPDLFHTIIASNKKAYYEYFIEETFEAGIALFGSEVKSLRINKGTIAESYADQKNGEIFLLGSYIAPLNEASHFAHSPTRPRKLLLHKKEINKLIGKLQTKGMTLVPLSLYFNEKNRVKLEMGLAKGKKLYDKRDTDKKRDWSREKARILRDK